jgi:2-deoxy-D-gluconate 3-dehydrogenase
MNYGLDDKVVLVTGGSRGIGLALARELLEQNAQVIICARKAEGLEKAAAELAQSERLTTVQAHVADADQVDALFETIKEKFGHLDVAVNNVGMNLPTPAIADLDPKLFAKIIDTNLTGNFLCARRAARLMRTRKRGKIVSITSLAAHRAAPMMGIYGIAKSAVEMLTKVLAAETAGDNIQVNAVAPAMVRTDFSKPFWSNQETLQAITQTIPMGRIAEPIDVVHPVLFLASQGSDFITGQTILVDGGASTV